MLDSTSAIHRLHPFRIALTAICLVAAALTAHSQTLTNAQRDAAEQRRIQERDAQLREQQDPSNDVRLKPVAKSEQLLPTSESPCFPIRQLELRGPGAGEFGWVLDSLSGPQKTDNPLRKCLGTQGIGILLERAQNTVVAKGFVTSLPTESKEALFSTSVQHGGGGANNALDQAFSSKLNNPAEDNFAIKQMQYNDAVKDGKALITQEKALITQREALITQIDQLKDQKIKLLENTQEANVDALKKIDQQISVVTQKIEAQSAKVQAQSAKVQANDAFIKHTQAAMQDAGFKASADPEEFIKDIYAWRIKSNPSEAKTRYIPERDMLLQQLKDRLEKEKAGKPK